MPHEKNPAPAPASDLATLVVAAVRQTKALDPVLLKVDQISSFTDYFFICSGSSSRQVQAIADHVLEQVKKQGGGLPLGIEGRSGGQWVLIDYGEIVIHVFHDPIRGFYDLEGLWVEAPRIDIEEAPSEKA